MQRVMSRKEAGYLISWAQVVVEIEKKEDLEIVISEVEGNEPFIEVKSEDPLTNLIVKTQADMKEEDGKGIRLNFELENFQYALYIKGIRAEEIKLSLSGDFSGFVELTGVKAQDLFVNLSEVPPIEKLVGGGKLSLKLSEIERRVELTGRLTGSSPTLQISESEMGILAIAGDLDTVELDGESKPTKVKFIEVRGPDEWPLDVFRIRELKILNAEIEHHVKISRSVSIGRVKIGHEEMYEESQNSSRVNTLSLHSVIFHDCRSFDKKAISGFSRLEVGSCSIGTVIIHLSSESEFSFETLERLEKTDMIEISLNNARIENRIEITAPKSPDISADCYVIKLRGVGNSSKKPVLILKGVDFSRISILNCELSEIIPVDVVWDHCRARGLYGGLRERCLSKGIFLPDAVKLFLGRKGVEVKDLNSVDELVKDTIERAYGKAGGLNEETPSLDWVRKLYLMLRGTLELSYSQYDISGELFIGEMRLLRYFSDKLPYRVGSYLYDILSSFGESLIRAVLWILILMIVPSILTVALNPGMVKGSGLIDCLRSMATVFLNYVQVVLPIKSDWELEGPIERILRVIGLSLLGLEFIALRRKFERRFWR